MLTVRLSTLSDVTSLAPRLREPDVNELKAAGRASPQQALVHGLTMSDVCFSAVDENDVPHAMFGVAPSTDYYTGIVWMLGSDELKAHWVQVLRETKQWVDNIRGHYRLLTNAVHAENRVHIRWLKWAGFTFLKKHSLGEHEFYEFAKLTPMEKINV